jgi:multiple sugar transport system substrate-binding protein
VIACSITLIEGVPTSAAGHGSALCARSPTANGGDRPAAWGSSHTLCLRADLDDRRLDAAKRFMKYLSDNSLDWAEGGQIPVRKSLRASERFQQMDAQREFAKQIPYAAYLPSVPFIFECLTEFDLAIEQALRGSRTPKQALDRCAAEMNRIMERYRRSGRWTPPAQVASAADVAGAER